MSTLHIAIALSLAACTSADPSQVARDPAAPGPWRVGVTTLTTIDPVDGQSLTLELWYPAVPDADAEPETTLGIPTHSVRGAPADPRGGSFPLIAFSHGSGGLRVQSVYMTEHLASWGYVVVAPDHPHDTLGSSKEDRPSVLRARPHQVSAAIDAALTSELADLIDPDRIGVVGHSFGAYTSLVLAGAKLDLPALRAACDADPEQLVCSGLDAELTEEVVAHFADPRIDAAVSLAPAGRAAFGASGLAQATAPVQIQGGTADTFSPPDSEVVPIFDGLAGTRSLVMIDRAAHFSFTDICALYAEAGGASGPLGFLATEGCGDNTLAVELAHAASRTLATAFLDVHVRQTSDEHAYLGHDFAHATVR